MGVVEHQQRRLAAEFQQHRLEILRRRLDSGFGGTAAIAELTELRWITIESHQHYPF